MIPVGRHVRLFFQVLNVKYRALAKEYYCVCTVARKLFGKQLPTFEVGEISHVKDTVPAFPAHQILQFRVVHQIQNQQNTRPLHRA